ncbi:MAG: outer membrane protein assembly factor BamC [Burkholderiaceae bacterium]|nr:outer membrane protein assembly factor BamC [Burkholderiaceae bacterium]MDO9089669.1 outer membrane protein assembly factor BamC [Burkholderiaceae bacterium]
MNQIARLGLLSLSLALAACSSMDFLDGDKVDYKSAGRGVSLDVPPDLTQLTRDNRYAIPGGAVTASGFQAAQPSPSAATAVSNIGDVRIERAGNQRWLVINRPADQLWGPVRDFWQESGFLLTQDMQSLGIMETDWAENRAKLPQDFIRSTIGRLVDSLYSTGERDRFRTRFERTAGGTEIYISHRGMIEVYTDRTQKAETAWQPRPADPELEAEFLRRLMIKLGVPQEQSRALVASGAPKLTSRVATVGNTPVVQIDEGFDRAWRRVGLTLDRTGFTVEDRDRAQGIYFVRYVAPNADRQEPGFFAKLLGRTPSAAPTLKYRISLKSQGEATTVTVLNAAGAPETSADAQRIVKVIADDLK